MRIYTKTGDAGQTGLIGGERIDKDSLRMHAIGDVDELNSVIGLCRLHTNGGHLEDLLTRIQSWLFDLGSELASPAGSKYEYRTVSEKHAGLLEESIDHQTAELEELKNFVLPGGSALGAHLHLARSVCRRAERSVLALRRQEDVRPEATVLLNRLSDWLFTSARTANHLSGVSDIKWSSDEA